jgi:sarcosine oxidase subunit beta
MSVTLYEAASIGAGASGRNTGTLLHQVEPEVAAMLRESIAAYTELARGVVNFQWIERPELLLARDTRQLATVRDKAATIAAQGVRVEMLEVADMRAEMPQLSEELAGGAVLYGAYSLDANASLHAVLDAARAEGITIRTGVRVAHLEIQAGRLRGLLTDDGRVAVDAAVLATGPWLSDLLPTVHVKSGRGWLLRSDVASFSVPWIIEEASWPDQIVLGAAGTPQPLEDLAGGGHDAPVGESFVLSPQINGQMLLGASLSTSLRDAIEGIDVPARLARRALELAPGLAGQLRISRAWSGLRPMTPDGLPLVGASDVAGLWIHAGHASLGVQAAPASAKWLAEYIVSGASNPYLERLAPDRFANLDT